MRRQLQGIAMILFGMSCLLWGLYDPWLPLVGDILTKSAPWLGPLFAVAGVVTVFRGD